MSVQTQSTSGASVTPKGKNAWELSIPAGPQGNYRLAQVDDYSSKKRSDFLWHSPLTLRLRARVSHACIPGTWGFGLWNDPFSLSFGFGGGTRRLPVLPNAAWFFFASPQNYLSLRDDLPANGFLAATFRSPPLSPALLAAGAPALPLLTWKPGARLFRRLARQIIRQDAAHLNLEPTQWHTYTLAWRSISVAFSVNDVCIFTSPIAPCAPLGTVIWLDNQYAALRPDGRLNFGTLPTKEEHFIAIEALEVTPLHPT